ncbi:Hemicentin-2 [Bagarius yarrelli]|uniref:Hemicentin-2 n=1 Tax=Bagarius yarrelli TaxID=175774 RepID=A0A556TTT5_BAGYA|nr:Hemicentin-2 [Bagarius yarrelli]
MEALGVTLLPALLTLNWVSATAAIDCTGFRHLENGRTFFRYGGLYITFSCNPGFRMYGHRTSSCMSGQWARDPPLCIAPGCPRPGKLLHGTAVMSPDNSLVQFSCNSGFKLFGSPLIYCNGKSWNGSTPECKELDIMNVFQEKQTSLYKPGLKLNQDTDLKSRFSAVAFTAAKETFLKSSLLGAPQPKLHLTGDLSKETRKLLNRRWHDQILTQHPEGAEEVVTQLTTFADPLNQPLRQATLKISPTISPFTPLIRLLSSIPVTSTTNDHQEQPTIFFLPEKTENFPSSTAQMQNELPVTPSQVVGVSKSNLDPIPTTVDSSTGKTRSKTLSTAPTALPETPKDSVLSGNITMLIESSTDEDISQSLQVTEKMNLTASTVSSLDLPVSQNKSSSPFIPFNIHDNKYFLWSPAAASTDPDLPPRIEPPTAHTPAIYTTPVAATKDLHPKHPATSNTTAAQEHLAPHRLSIGQIDDISRSNKVDPVNRWTSAHDQKNRTAKETMDSTTKHNGTISAFSGFPVLQTTKRRAVCPYPPLPAHGTFYFHTIANPAPFQYKHYIQYACYAGYTLANGDVYSYCLGDGQWSGVTPMCIGLTRCSVNNGGCSQVCQVNSRNHAECHCQPGFLLLGDQRTCRDLDECVEGLHECQQVCENTFGSYRCSCRLGFQLSSDRMSCIAGLARCVFGCVNTPGSFRCLCPAGYSMNITDGHCEDLDECGQNAGVGPCATACVNTPGSFYCVCSSGYRLAGDGTSCMPECPPGYHRKHSNPPGENSTLLNCVDINECDEMKQMQHHQQHKCEWKCVNLPGTHRCICPRGYTQHANGYQCKDINECTLKNGGCSHICINHKGGYRCACPENYRVSPHSRKMCQQVQNSQLQ